MKRVVGGTDGASGTALMIGRIAVNTRTSTEC